MSELPRVQVTRNMLGSDAGIWALVYMQVCAVADATDEEILRVCNTENPSGTSLGWTTVVRNDDDHPISAPVQCADDPNRLHFLVAC